MRLSLSSIPLLVIPSAIYNLLAVVMVLTTQGPDGPHDFMSQAFLAIPMLATGAVWRISSGDLILMLCLTCLFFEVVGASKSSNDVILNHILSMILFIVCIVEFLLGRPFGTSTFFLLTIMTALDVLAGFIITTMAARKDIGFG